MIPFLLRADPGSQKQERKSENLTYGFEKPVIDETSQFAELKVSVSPHA
jgi:hypothetical protein